MAENLQKEPEKGILKHEDKKREKQFQWDEMNIIATHHPADKDYGHMKIDEPKTPYNYVEEEEAGHQRKPSFGEQNSQICANELMSKLQDGSKPKALSGSPTFQDDSLTEEEIEHRHNFEEKRKKHYNEFQAMQMARQMMDDEEN